MIQRSYDRVYLLHYQLQEFHVVRVRLEAQRISQQGHLWPARAVGNAAILDGQSAHLGRPRATTLAARRLLDECWHQHGVWHSRLSRAQWNLDGGKEEREGKTNRKRKRSNEGDDDKAVHINFADAHPTLTHRAIAKLIASGDAQYCITQNVDGLHRRSGLSRRHHSVLQGCVFTEQCRDCGLEYFHDVDMGGMSFQPTGRHCEECGGVFCDTLLDWEDPLPEVDLERSMEACEQADLVVAVGTSLRIEPAGSLPALAKKFVIINLQQTTYDDKAALIIRGRADDVMRGVMDLLGHGDWDGETPPPIERTWKPVDRDRESST